MHPQLRDRKGQLVKGVRCGKREVQIFRKQFPDRFKQAVHSVAAGICTLFAFLMKDQRHPVQRVQLGVEHDTGFRCLPYLLGEDRNTGVVCRQQAGVPFLRRAVCGVPVLVDQIVVLQLPVSGKNFAKNPAIMLYGGKLGKESGIICQTVGELFCSLLQIAAVNPAGEKLCLDVDGSLDVGCIDVFIVVEVRKNLTDRTAAVS